MEMDEIGNDQKAISEMELTFKPLILVFLTFHNLIYHLHHLSLRNDYELYSKQNSFNQSGNQFD